jgi:hypothetical protein
MKVIYIFLDEQGSTCKVADGRGRRAARHIRGVNSVEYAPFTQRKSKAAHMEHINPKESNQKKQTRTQPHRDPNQQSDDMNPKKKEKEVLIIPAENHGYQSAKRTKQ